jgi:hypothetical protein
MRQRLEMRHYDGEIATIDPAAAGRASLEGGDIEGVGIWRAIMSAIGELQRGRGPDEAVNR